MTKTTKAKPAVRMFRVVVESYIHDRVFQPGDMVEIDTSIMTPGDNLEAVDAPAAAAVAADGEG